MPKIKEELDGQPFYSQQEGAQNLIPLSVVY
jgi:hypothetical protein